MDFGQNGAVDLGGPSAVVAVGLWCRPRTGDQPRRLWADGSVLGGDVSPSCGR